METLFLVRDPSKQGLTNAVQGAGYYTVCAPDADTALTLVGALRANLFIIDVGDPAVIGERALERLRALRNYRHTPVILIGARRAQYQQLARRVGVGEVMLAGEDGEDHLLPRVGQLLLERRAAEAVNEVVEPFAWERAADVERTRDEVVPTATIRRWIASDVRCARN